MKKVFGVCLVLGFGLGGCGKSEAEKARDTAEMNEIKQNILAREFVEYNLKDPDSAEFRNQKGFCGEVNAKNSYGGFTGYKRFIAADKNLVVTEGDLSLSTSEFQKVWDAACK